MIKNNSAVKLKIVIQGLVSLGIGKSMIDYKASIYIFLKILKTNKTEILLLIYFYLCYKT